jgi:hypothetical protein
VVAGAVSLVVRFRRTRGTECLQLRWVALAAGVVLLGSVVVLAALTLGTLRSAPLGRLVVRPSPSIYRSVAGAEGDVTSWCRRGSSL